MFFFIMVKKLEEMDIEISKEQKHSDRNLYPIITFAIFGSAVALYLATHPEQIESLKEYIANLGKFWH